MESEIELKKLRPIVEDLARLAQILQEQSQNFPAIHRNSRRILASVEMLRINLGQDLD